MRDELKPCPFCGRPPILTLEGVAGDGITEPFYVRCLRCDLKLTHKTRAGVTAAWNTRQAQAQVSEGVADAALALYMAGRWDCATLPQSEQARLWEALRDALTLPHGTATSAGVNGNG